MEANEKQKHRYRDLLVEKEYLKNLCAEGINRFGDSVDAIAFSWLVYTLTGSAALTAVTYGVNYLVSVLLLPTCGALVTNMSKQIVMVISDICRGVLVCINVALYVSGLIEPWMLICSTGLMSAFEAFRKPAGSAVFPLLIPKEKYTAAMSLKGSVSTIADLGGKGLAGTIIAIGGIGAALAVDIITFFISASILMTIKLPEQTKDSFGKALHSFADNAKGGLRYLRGSKVMIALCFLGFALNLTSTPLFSLQTPFVNEGLKLDVQALSTMGFALSGGMLIGSALYPKISSVVSRFHLLIAGCLGESLSYFLLAGTTYAPEVWMKYGFLVLVMGMFGFSSAMINNGMQIGFMIKADKTQVSRMSGLMNALCLASVPISTFAVAGLSTYFSVTTLIVGSGIISILILFTFFLVKPLREL